MRWGRCEVCRSERQSSALVRDDQSGLIRCSNRALCASQKQIRDAREAAREAQDMADGGLLDSARIVAELETGELARKAEARRLEQNRRRSERKVAERAKRRAEREAEKELVERIRAKQPRLTKHRAARAQKAGGQ